MDGLDRRIAETHDARLQLKEVVKEQMVEDIDQLKSLESGLVSMDDRVSALESYRREVPLPPLHRYCQHDADSRH